MQNNHLEENKLTEEKITSPFYALFHPIKSYKIIQRDMKELDFLERKRDDLKRKREECSKINECLVTHRWGTDEDFQVLKNLYDRCQEEFQEILERPMPKF